MKDIDTYTSISRTPSYLQGSVYLTLDVLPKITNADIQNGTITRYFARQTNLPNGEIIEVTKSQYDQLKNIPLYTIVQIPWKISGPTADVSPPPLDNMPTRMYTGVVAANQQSIQLGNRELPGLSNKLINPLQFYQG